MIFPDRFRPSEWVGRRAKEHPNREDAFQQLVGDGLREVVGIRAHVSPTMGRDGSIDAFVETSRAQGEHLLGLPPPLIIECKDHDDLARDPKRNVDEGWRRVEEKLSRQARLGWPGAFAPWKRARSFLYAVSLVLPDQQSRDGLRDRIVAFFQSLPIEQRPSVEEVVVLDWSDLRDWLDRMPRVVDRWIGTGSAKIIEHESFVNRLVGFKRYLTPAALPFVAPQASQPTHPERVLEGLTQRAGEGGLLLVGVGGIGKTRTATEVGTLAEDRGWRVLHVQAGEPTVENQELGDVILAGHGRTLMVLDYLDQMHRLDPGYFRHRLFPEARARGIDLALLATARPGSIIAGHPEWPRLLTEVHLSPAPGESQAIARMIRATLAPHATALIGDDRISELCGERPIIGMFVARELEHRAIEGTLDRRDVESFRAGDLLAWLRRRLSENGLIVPVTTALLPSEPDSAVVAAAAVLGCAPDQQTRLVAVAESLLANRRQFAGLIVENLVALGWLDRLPAELAAAHDVVADELLEQILRARPADAVRVHVLSSVLNAVMWQARSLGRMATSLGRLAQSGIANDEFFAEAVKRGCEEWLREHGRDIGATFSEVDADEASYALGAVVASRVFRYAAFEHWDDIVGPWLARYGTSLEARHVLYAGLRHSSGVADRNIGAGANATGAIDRALAWLALPHGRVLEAQYVLRPLLSHPQLTGESATGAIDRALAWLALPHGRVLEAGFVLPALLRRPELAGSQVEDAVDVALRWLAKFFREQDAEFVLRALLTHHELSRQKRAWAASRALDRLETILETEEASYLLRWVLSVRGLPVHIDRVVVRVALRWLQRHPTASDLDFAANRLLRRPNLSDSNWLLVASMAISWLQLTAYAPNRDYTLYSCLLRAHLLDDGARAFLAQDSEAFLSAFPVDPFFADRLRALATRANSLIAMPPSPSAASIDRQLADDLSSLAENPDSTVPDELVRRGIVAIEQRLNDNRPGAVGHYLAPLLPLVERIHSGFERAKVMGLVGAMLAHPLLQRRSRDGFTLAVLRLIDAGAWPNPDLGRAVLSSLGLPTSPEGLIKTASAELLRLAHRHEPLSEDIVVRGADHAEQLINEGNPGAAGYLLAPLLPLANRTPNAALLARIQALTRKFLNHDRLRERQREGFYRACRQLVRLGAWPAVESGWSLLTELGVPLEALPIDEDGPLDQRSGPPLGPKYLHSAPHDAPDRDVQ